MEKSFLKKCIKEGKSTREIAFLNKICQTTIRYWLDKYGLKTDPYKNNKRQCVFCGKNIKNKKYCNNRCQQDYLWKIKKEEIEAAEEISAINTGKRYLKEIRGNKCEICDIESWNGKDLVMIMDHINGDSTNNKIPNLRLICSNCDSQLPTYKAKNKGNGRHLRRERYAEGKSF